MYMEALCHTIIFTMVRKFLLIQFTSQSKAPGTSLKIVNLSQKAKTLLCSILKFSVLNQIWHISFTIIFYVQYTSDLSLSMLSILCHENLIIIFFPHFDGEINSGTIHTHYLSGINSGTIHTHYLSEINSRTIHSYYLPDINSGTIHSYYLPESNSATIPTYYLPVYLIS